MDDLDAAAALAVEEFGRCPDGSPRRGQAAMMARNLTGYSLKVCVNAVDAAYAAQAHGTIPEAT
jgi:hypothetical protein